MILWEDLKAEKINIGQKNKNEYINKEINFNL